MSKNECIIPEIYVIDVWLSDVILQDSQLELDILVDAILVS